MDITPRHLEQLNALHQYGNFRRAAEKLCISQPALSRSILLLEEKLGVKFFDRTRGQLVLTQYGRIVLDRGESILKELRLLHRDIDMLQGGQQGLLTIGCGPIPAQTLAGHALAQFNKFYPQMTVRLIIDHAPRLTQLLRNRSIDFFVAEADQMASEQEYEITTLPQQQGYFCCRKNHPLMAYSPLTFKEFFKFPMALMWLPDRMFRLLSELSGEKIQKIEDIGTGCIECDNVNMLLCVVSNSDCITITSREIVDNSIYKGAVSFLPLKIPELRSGYAMVSLKGFSTIPALSYLKNFFIETAAQKVQVA